MEKVFQGNLLHWWQPSLLDLNWLVVRIHSHAQWTFSLSLWTLWRLFLASLVRSAVPWKVHAADLGILLWRILAMLILSKYSQTLNFLFQLSLFPFIPIRLQIFPFWLSLEAKGKWDIRYGFGSVRLTAGFDDLKGLFHAKCFCCDDSVGYCLLLFHFLCEMWWSSHLHSTHYQHSLLSIL